MKSLIDDALEVHELMKDTKMPSDAPDDAELAKIVETLKVNIAIVGCGGGGTNTINRLCQEGVFGAELVSRGDLRRAWASTVHAVKGVALSVGVELTGALLATVAWAVGVYLTI